MSLRVSSLLLKSLRQQWRDPLSLALTLLTAPAFVLFYWFFLSHTQTLHAGFVAPESMYVAPLEMAFAGMDDVEVHRYGSASELEAALQDGSIDAGFVLGASLESPARLYGDPRATAQVQPVLMTYARAVTGRDPPIRFEQAGPVRRPFDAYVPGLIVFAIIMLVFSSSLAVAREVESGTLVRLKLAGVRAWQILLGYTGVQLVLGIVTVWLTLGVAVLLGFRAEGSLAATAVVALLGCASSIGLGVLIASWTRTTQRAFLVSSVVMFALLLFSGVVFPQPRVPVFTWAGRAVELFDALPTTQVTRAFRSILVYGATLGAVRYELVWLGLAALGFFALGAAVFRRVEKL